MSVRRIAAAVFGDARFRGRVERILRRPPEVTPLTDPSLADPALEGIDLGELEWTALIRLLFERRLAWLAASGEAPSMNELDRDNFFVLSNLRFLCTDFQCHRGARQAPIPAAEPA